MIAEIEPQAGAGTFIRRINLGHLHPSPTNPRKHFDAEGLAELASSIEEHGIKMPLLARPSKTEAGQFEIVAGERRFRANTLLVTILPERIELASDNGNVELVDRLTTLYAARLDVPVIVEDLDDATVLELQLVENLQRRDLTALEEAEGYQRLLDLKEKGYTPEKIAQKIGRTARTVLHKLRMLQAPRTLRDALNLGLVGERHLVLVASIPGKKQREEAAKAILDGEFDYEEAKNVALSVRETITLINRKYRQSLKGAPWKLDDAELVSEAGACANCPFFAGFAATQDAELAAELGNCRGQTDPLTCMKPDCFKSKQDAVWQRRQQEAKDGTVKVLKPAEASKIVGDDGWLIGSAARSRYVKLDDKPSFEETGSYDNSKLPTWRELMEDRLPSGSIVVVNAKDAGIVELVERPLAIETARGHAEHGKIFSQATSVKPKKEDLTTAERKKLDKERFEKRVEARMRHALLGHLHDCALTKGMGAETSLAVLETALYEAGMDGNRLLCEWKGWEPEPAKKGSNLSQDNYRAAILKQMKAADCGKPEIDAMIMCAILAKWIKAYGMKISSLAPLQKHFGFDEKTIRALATAEVNAEQATKAKKKPDTKAVSNASDPVNWSADAEASKVKAADKIAKRGMKKEAAPEPVKVPVGGLLEHVYLPEAKLGKATGWTPADVEAGAKVLKAKTHDITTLIGPKPDRKKDAIAYKNWNGLRMKLLRKAAK